MLGDDGNMPWPAVRTISTICIAAVSGVEVADNSISDCEVNKQAEHNGTCSVDSSLEVNETLHCAQL